MKTSQYELHTIECQCLAEVDSNSQQPYSPRAILFIDRDIDDLPMERALGVRWNVGKDMFGFKVVSCDKPDTMRGVLSCVSSFYDHLGLAAPVILLAKQILRDS